MLNALFGSILSPFILLATNELLRLPLFPCYPDDRRIIYSRKEGAHEKLFFWQAIVSALILFIEGGGTDYSTCGHECLCPCRSMRYPAQYNFQGELAFCGGDDGLFNHPHFLPGDGIFIPSIM